MTVMKFMGLARIIPLARKARRRKKTFQGKLEALKRFTSGRGIFKTWSKEFVEAFFEELRVALETGGQIKLSGFGNFDIRDKNERPGRNPKTGEEIPISARRVVTFKPGQKLKARVEAYAGSVE